MGTLNVRNGALSGPTAISQSMAALGHKQTSGALLLFVGGVMNPVWIAGIVALVLVEKLLPSARWVLWLAGAALVAAGLWLLVKT